MAIVYQSISQIPKGQERLHRVVFDDSTDATATATTFKLSSLEFISGTGKPLITSGIQASSAEVGIFADRDMIRYFSAINHRQVQVNIYETIGSTESLVYQGFVMPGNHRSPITDGRETILIVDVTDGFTSLESIRYDYDVSDSVNVKDMLWKGIQKATGREPDFYIGSNIRFHKGTPVTREMISEINVPGKFLNGLSWYNVLDLDICKHFNATLTYYRDRISLTGINALGSSSSYTAYRFSGATGEYLDSETVSQIDGSNSNLPRTLRSRERGIDFIKTVDMQTTRGYDIGSLKAGHNIAVNGDFDYNQDVSLSDISGFHLNPDTERNTILDITGSDNNIREILDVGFDKWEMSHGVQNNFPTHLSFGFSPAGGLTTPNTLAYVWRRDASVDRQNQFNMFCKGASDVIGSFEDPYDQFGVRVYFQYRWSERFGNPGESKIGVSYIFNEINPEDVVYDANGIKQIPSGNRQFSWSVADQKWYPKGAADTIDLTTKWQGMKVFTPDLTRYDNIWGIVNETIVPGTARVWRVESQTMLTLPGSGKGVLWVYLSRPVITTPAFALGTHLLTWDNLNIQELRAGENDNRGYTTRVERTDITVGETVQLGAFVAGGPFPAQFDGNLKDSEGKVLKGWKFGNYTANEAVTDNSIDELIGRAIIRQNASNSTLLELEVKLNDVLPGPHKRLNWENKPYQIVYLKENLKSGFANITAVQVGNADPETETTVMLDETGARRPSSGFGSGPVIPPSIIQNVDDKIILWAISNELTNIRNEVVVPSGTPIWNLTALGTAAGLSFGTYTETTFTYNALYLPNNPPDITYLGMMVEAYDGVVKKGQGFFSWGPIHSTGSQTARTSCPLSLAAGVFVHVDYNWSINDRYIAMRNNFSAALPSNITLRLYGVKL